MPRIRVAHLLAIGSVGLVSAIVACSGDDEPVALGPTAGITSGEYKGELGGQGETGVLDVTLSGGGLKPSALRELDAQDQATAVGTVTVQGHGTFQLTGTFDPDTGVLTLSGGGYAFSGKVAGGGFSGTYTGPYGSGSFTLIKGSGAQIFCGTYTGPDDGIWNLVVGPTSAGGSVANTKGTYSSPMACTVSGASLSCTASGGVTATGAVSGATASGTWSDGSGHAGTWTGATAACPVPVTPVPDAGSTDAHAPVDASGVDASGHDAAGGPDAATDAQGAPDTGAPDAGPDAVATDASGAADSSSGDAATTTDASSSVDASGGADSSTVDAAVTDSGSLDAGTSTTDAGATDAAIVDAGQCPHMVDIQTVTQVVYLDTGTVTQLGVGTINYPVNINTSPSVCPGVTRIEASLGSNPNTWTDIGACTGKGTGPNSYCYGITIPTSFLAAVDTLKLRAVNPGVNQGAPSGTIAIAPGNPTPVITGASSTANLVSGGGAQQLTLTGTGFTGHSTAEADVSGIDAGVATIPAVISFTSTSITIEFSAAFTATPQPYFLVKVINPGTPAPLFGYWGQSIRVQ